MEKHDHGACKSFNMFLFANGSMQSVITVGFLDFLAGVVRYLILIICMVHANDAFRSMLMSFIVL